jgi:hypothetical protein
MTKKMIYILMVISLLTIATGCAEAISLAPADEEGVELLAADQDGTGQSDQESIDLLTGKEAEGEVLNSDENADSNISSTGEEKTNTSSDDDISLDSGSGQGSGAAGKKVVWLTYEDAIYKFSVEYPDVYVILDEPEDLAAIDPTLLYRVRFQDQALATGDTAALELPQFTIEVFDNISHLSLGEYLDQKASEEGERSEFTLGDLSGYKIMSKHPLGPNEFYYFAHGDYIFKLTPLGQYSNDILLSFQIEE